MAKKLEEIKEEECLYELPEGWKWERLGNVTEVASGGTPSSKVKEYYNGDIAWITPADLSGYKKIYISCGAKNITKIGLDKSSAKLLPKDTVLLSSRAPIGYVVIARNELSTNQGFKNFLPSDDYLPKYLYWYLKGNKDLLESYASGTTFLELSASKAKMIEFPLAPKETQQKIIDIIESLFAKLDVAQEKVEQVLSESENRRSAILHNAFSGKLTEKWRKENGVSFHSWNKTNFSDIIIQMQNGLSKRNGESGLLYGVLRLANIDDYSINLNDLRYILLDDKEQEKYALKENDVIMIRVNGSKDNVGKQILVPQINNIAFCDHIIRIVYNNEIVISNFMVLLSYTRDYRNYIEEHMVSSAGQNTISRKGMNDYNIVLPTISEQKEIVRLLDKFLSVEDKVKSTCQTTLETIATMRKSILAKAFRGELCS